MKNKVMFGLIFSALLSSSSYAACDRQALAGTWTRTEVDAGQVDSSRTITWDTSNGENSLVVDVKMNDNWTATGSFGPYFEQITFYTVANLDRDCRLSLAAGDSILRSFRMYDEPTPSVSERTIDERGKTKEYQIKIEGDVLTLRGDDGVSVQMTRKRI